MATESKETAVESMEQINARLQEQLERQRQANQNMQSGGVFASFKNANFKIGGQAVPNNKAEVRVLAAIQERAYYDEEYDADKTQVPVCYALDSDEPHDEARDPQSSECESCEHNKWGTGPRGRGKACREGSRLIFVAGNVPLKSAQMITAKIPVSSIKHVTAMTSRISDAGKLLGEFKVNMRVEEDKKTFFKVHFDLIEHTPNMDMRELLTAQEKAYQLAMQPYPDLEGA